MSAETHRTLLRLALLLFLLILPAMQWVAFRELARRGAHDALRASRNTRDHVLGALGRAAQAGLILEIPPLLAWSVAAWPRLRWEVLIGAEILLSFVVLALGLTAVALRFALDLAGRTAAGSLARAVAGLRLLVLGIGLSYGAALWFAVPGGAGETLLSVFLLGAGLVALGLNRTAEMDPELLRKLVRAGVR